MKILVLTKKYPYPLNDGESIAVVSLARALYRLGHELHLLSMNTVKDYSDVKASCEELTCFARIESIDIDNRISLSGAIRAAAQNRSYHVARFYSTAFAERLKKMMRTARYDIIQMESSYLGIYIDQIRDLGMAKIVLRSHNIEHLIWSRIAEHEPSYLRALYLKYSVWLLQAYEEKMAHHLDLILPMSAQDAGFYNQLNLDADVKVLPIGIDMDRYKKIQRPIILDHLSFIGSLDWWPNLQGLDWFIKDVWPAMNKQNPDVCLNIAGKNSAAVEKRWSAVKMIFHGEVDNAKAFMRQYPIMVVPLLAGSGLRVKILEAMALGCIVISTAIGAEGIDAIDGEDFFIANNRDELLKTIERLHQMKTRELSNISNNARQFVLLNYSIDVLARRLVGYYDNLLS